MFDKFISALKTELGKNLPGTGAQYRMAPPGRAGIDHSKLPGYAPKVSGVLILFYPFKEQVKLLLMLRPSYKGAHGGQVSFPGGKFEEEDITLERTAIREAHEEVGFDPLQVKIIGRLTELYIPPSNFLVHPFVAYCNTRPQFKLNQREVEKILEVDVQELLDVSIIKTKVVMQSGTGIKLEAPYFDLHGETVWGATAMMLSELNEILERII
ncbi:MAG TPA: CoA pyrophosphatase [Bacteroidia bacterium]